MAARNILARCTAFSNHIPIESLRIRDKNAMHLVMAITKIGDRGIRESGNHGIREKGNLGIGEYGNGKRYRYAVYGMINNYHIRVYFQKIKGISDEI